MEQISSHKRILSFIILVSIFLAGALFLFFGKEWSRETHGAGTNINDPGAYPNNHWAWNEVIDWIDFYPASNPTVVVTNSTVTGFASSSVGSIYLDCASSPSGCGVSYGVVNDGAGNLSGSAWNDTIGWVHFCGGQSTSTCPGTTTHRVLVDGNGEFKGYAWNDNIGWIDFNCINRAYCGTVDYRVKTSWSASSSYGWLESATFDTGVTGGAQINSILWRGSAPSSSFVRFQMAFSNNVNGPWSFGWDSTGSYSPAINPNTPLPIDYTLGANQRYFRYRIYLYSDLAHSATPRVNDVVVNWSR